MKILQILPILAIGFALHACSTTPTLEDAHRAWNPDAKYYESLSFEDLENQAELEDPDALLELGMRLINGDQTERDEVRAINAFSKLSAMNDPRGHYMLGAAYAQGAGVIKDEARAVELFRKGAEGGYDIAQYWYGFMISRGRGVPQENWEEAVIWFEKSALQGNPDGEFAFGEAIVMCMGGLTQDFDLAAEWFRKAARQGHKVAEANVWRLIVTGLIEWQEGDYGEPPKEFEPLQHNSCAT